MPAIEHFKNSAKMKIQAASKLLEKKFPFPTEAAYLSSLALECSLKCLILNKNSIKRTESFSDSHQLLFLFSGKQGHNLEKLRKASHLDFPNNAAWERMKSNDRPYSLRYGNESLNHKQSAEEWEFVKERLLAIEELQ